MAEPQRKPPEQDAKDAVRYRWLRDNDGDTHETFASAYFNEQSPAAFDAAIDAAKELVVQASIRALGIAPLKQSDPDTWAAEAAKADAALADAKAAHDVAAGKVDVAPAPSPGVKVEP